MYVYLYMYVYIPVLVRSKMTHTMRRMSFSPESVNLT